MKLKTLERPSAQQELGERQYLYCIVSSGDELTFAAPGVTGSPVHTINYRGLAAVVSTSHGDRLRKHQAQHDGAYESAGGGDALAHHFADPLQQCGAQYLRRLRSGAGAGLR